MIPTHSTVIVCLLWIGIAILGIFFPVFNTYWQWAGNFFLMLILFEAWRVYRLPNVTASRHVSPTLTLGKWQKVAVTLSNTTSNRYHVNIFDGYPTGSELLNLPQIHTILAHSSLTIHYKNTSSTTGQYTI